MTPRDLVIYLSMLMLCFVGFYYGWRFLQLKNRLLGIEWFVIGGNSFNGILYTTGLSATAGVLWVYIDIFSKLVGVTIIGAIGLMKVTHRIELSLRQEIALWAAGLLVAWGFMSWGPLQAALPVAALAMGLAFMGLLVYITQQAFALNLRRHGWLMVTVIAVNLVIAAMQDFVKLPGDETAIFFNKLVLEHVVWALSFAELYYVYAAIARAKAAEQNAARPEPAWPNRHTAMGR